jgi:hypothetical protein
MIHSSRRDRKTKAIAEVLAMLADAHPELAPHRPHSVRETDEWLSESATEFSVALEKYYAEHAMQMKRENPRAALKWRAKERWPKRRSRRVHPSEGFSHRGVIVIFNQSG